jgi:hypothetical protein
MKDAGCCRIAGRVVASLRRNVEKGFTYFESTNLQTHCVIQLTILIKCMDKMDGEIDNPQYNCAAILFRFGRLIPDEHRRLNCDRREQPPLSVSLNSGSALARSPASLKLFYHRVGGRAGDNARGDPAGECSHVVKGPDKSKKAILGEITLQATRRQEIAQEF